MLIGISGYMGSGKDAVADLIMKLTDTPFNWAKGVQYQPSPFQKVKFAGPLKTMVSILTGIPVQDLEKEEVKNMELGPEWDREVYYRRERRIKGGDLESISLTDRGYKPAISKAEIEEVEIRVGFTTPGMGLYHTKRERMTVRMLLQELGTNAMRDTVHPNIHINAVFAKWKERDHWILSDCRFPNEAEAIKERGGIVIRVNRPSKIEKALGDSLKGIPVIHETNRHASETSLDHFQFDYVINNDDHLKALEPKVLSFLYEAKIKR